MSNEECANVLVEEGSVVNNNVKTDEATSGKKDDKPQVNLLDVRIDSEVDALNVIVGFLGIAQRRGCFAINESAKIYECVKMFNKKE